MELKFDQWMEMLNSAIVSREEIGKVEGQLLSLLNDSNTNAQEIVRLDELLRGKTGTNGLFSRVENLARQVELFKKIIFWGMGAMGTVTTFLLVELAKRSIWP